MDKFIKYAEKGDIDSLELEWMEASETPEPDWPDMLIAARVIAKKHDPALAQSLVIYLVSALEGSGRLYEALKAFEQACRFLPDNDPVRMEYAAIYSKVHGGEPWREAVLDITLKNTSIRLADALALLERLEQLPPGTYVRQDPGAKIGMVEEIMPKEGLKVKAGGSLQTIPVERVDQLQPLSRNDIRALVLFEEERLRGLSEDNPFELLRLVLNTFDGRTAQDRIRRYLKPVVGERGWSGWWKRTRKLAENASDIGSSGGKSPQFFIRSEPVSRPEELRQAFERAGASDRPGLALEIAGEIAEIGDDSTELILHLALKLEATGREVVSEDPSLAAAALAALWRLGKISDSVAEKAREVPDWAGSVDWVELLCGELRAGPYSSDVIDFLPQWLPERWSEVLIEALPRLPQKECSRAVQSLKSLQDMDMPEDAVSAVLNRPDARLGALTWIWNLYRRALAGRENIPGLDGPALLRRVLSAAASEGRACHSRSSSDDKDLKALKPAFSGEGEDAVEAVARNLGDQEIMALINLIDRNPGINDYTRKRLARAVRAARPELFRISTAPWESGAVYTTEQGLQRRRSMYSELVNVKLPEVVRQVGEAADFGDLSENAEYTAAMEERERLSRAADRMKGELDRARLITPEMLDPTHVGIGSKVKALDCNTEKEEELIFLGPWDADPKSGVYDYNSPIGRAFMGTEKGHTVNYESPSGEKRWKVLDIEPAHEFL